MKKFHLALTTQNLTASITDYTHRLGALPTLVIPAEYALWRTETLNLSLRQDLTCKPGQLRHLGWEDPAAETLTESQDVNGVTWEQFTAQQQADEIAQIWPGVQYRPGEA